jgi:Transposase IS4
MVRLTSEKLSRNGKRSLCAGEMLKFIGILVLGTRYKFRKISDLWSTEARDRLLCAPAFGSKTGMSRKRFEEIWNSQTFSLQGETRDVESSTEYKWRLVDDFYEAINSHRAANFTRLSSYV